MPLREIKDRVFSVGAIDWDRTLFDELIPLPDGTSYNSYLILGSEKNVLIDTVDPTLSSELLNNLERLQIEKLDYLVVNHAEQDHSGSVDLILESFPECKVVSNKKCMELLIDHLDVEEGKFHIVEDNDTISLGDKTLQFIMVPWVHWPETMATFLIEDRILFPCDFFGSHKATSDLYSADDSNVYNDAKRYYAEIMMPFRKTVSKNIAKVEKLKPQIIAPSHGPIYSNPKFIIDAYKDWTSDDVKNEVVLPYVSMHDSTRYMVDFLIDSLIERGITVKPFNLTVADIGELAMALVDAATIVLATPTILSGPHPSAAYAAILANALRPKTKFATIIGSYGWGGKTVDILVDLMKNLKVEILEPVLVKGLPKEKDYQALDKLVEKIYLKHKEIGIII